MNPRIQHQQRTLTASGSGYTYTASDQQLGWQNIGFSLTSFQSTANAGFEYQTHSDAESFVCREVSEIEHGLQLTGDYNLSGLAEVITLRLLNNGALRLDRKLHNNSTVSTVVRGAALGGQAGGKPIFSDNHIWRARCCHTDNVRTEKFPWCRPEYPYVRGLPKTDTVFGNQESQSIPAMVLTNDTYSQLLLEGQLAQNKTRVQWKLSAGAGEIIGSYELQWSMHNGGFELHAGESLQLEPIYFEVLQHTHPQDAWSGYIDAVTAENRLQDEKNTLLSTAFYCSWNYGVFQDIDEEKLLRTARFVSDHMPAVKHFLIDGGWQSHEAVQCPSCANFYLPEGQWHNAALFPNGMKAMADKIRETGLEPAIWWTPSVALHSTLAKEHPEWLAKDASGSVYRIGQSGFLDYSLKPVQDYLHQVFATLFEDWGYRAMKMDFWAQSVESDNIRFATGTGVKWRDWLLSSIQSYLPHDGFLMTCVAVAMGNPFLGKHAQTHRCSIDVGACDWREHVLSSVWNLPMHAIESRRTILPNVDGIGWSSKMTDSENLHRLTYAFITMGSLEVDGRLEEVPTDKIALLNRVLANMDRGHPARCPDGDAFTGVPLPKCLYVDYPQASPTARRGIAKHIALFNWTDERQCTGYTAKQLGLLGATTARDFWSDEEVSLADGDICIWLSARSARLLEVAAVEQ